MRSGKRAWITWDETVERWWPERDEIGDSFWRSFDRRFDNHAGPRLKKETLFCPVAKGSYEAKLRALGIWSVQTWRWQQTLL